LLYYAEFRKTGKKPLSKVDVSGTTQGERDRKLLQALKNAEENTIINLEAGVYDCSNAPDAHLVVKTPHLKIVSPNGATIKSHLVISASNISVSGINFSKLSSSQNENISLKDVKLDELYITGVNSLQITNSTVSNVDIKRSENIVFTHCSIVSGTGKTALSSTQSDVELLYSIVYSKGVALTVVRPGSKRVAKIKVRRSICFGESAYGEYIEGQAPPVKLNKSSTMRKIISPSSVIYKVPIFKSLESGDFKLKKPSPGMGKAPDNKDIGVN